MSWTQTPAKFRAVEAEHITGISRELQRSLRKRGFLPQVEGWAAFELLDLAYLFVIGRLATAGIGPKAAQRIASNAKVILKVRAQELPGAVSDPLALRGHEPLTHVGPRPPGGRGGFPTERFLVAFVDEGAETYSDDVASAFDESDRDVAVVIDLDRVARRIVERAQRPLIIIEAEGGRS